MINYLSPNYPLLAEKLFVNGFEPIPLPPGQKRPTLKGWPNIKLPTQPWPKNYEIGLRTGKLTAIDIDICNPGTKVIS